MFLAIQEKRQLCLYAVKQKQEPRHEFAPSSAEDNRFRLHSGYKVRVTRKELELVVGQGREEVESEKALRRRKEGRGGPSCSVPAETSLAACHNAQVRYGLSYPPNGCQSGHTCSSQANPKSNGIAGSCEGCSPVSSTFRSHAASAQANSRSYGTTEDAETAGRSRAARSQAGTGSQACG